MIITTTATSSISGGGLYIGVASFPISPLLTSTIKSRSLKASPHHHHSRRRLLCVRCLSSLSEDSSLILHHHRHHHRLPLSSYSIKSRPVGDSLHHHHHCRRHLRQAPSPCLSVCCSSSLSDMDGTGGPSLYPLHHCKTLHLVRHAQGIHNVDGDKNYKAYMKLEYFDAQLTPLGWQQVDNLRKHVHACGLFKTVDLVITSPLLRTMQTAVGVFGGEGYTDRMDVVPLMVANAGNSDRPAISSLDCPPIIAVEHCREHLGVHPCDMRRSISEYQRLFPAVDFSLIETDEDVLWKADIRETKEELEARGMKFMNWLLTRKEREIAIVTHSGFLFHTLSAFGNDSHPLVKKEICKHFANCELRSMVIVDKSMLGSDLSTTNYPGKIPPGPDLPSDVVDEKNLN